MLLDVFLPLAFYDPTSKYKAAVAKLSTGIFNTVVSPDLLHPDALDLFLVHSLRSISVSGQQSALALAGSSAQSRWPASGGMLIPAITRFWVRDTKKDIVGLDGS